MGRVASLPMVVALQQRIMSKVGYNLFVGRSPITLALGSNLGPLLWSRRDPKSADESGIWDVRWREAASFM